MAENYLNKLTKDHSKPAFAKFGRWEEFRKAFSYLKQLRIPLNKNNQVQGGNSKGFDNGLDVAKMMAESATGRPRSISAKPQESATHQATNNIVPSPRNTQTNSSTQLAAQQKMIQDTLGQTQQANQQAQSSQQQALNQRQIKERTSF